MAPATCDMVSYLRYSCVRAHTSALLETHSVSSVKYKICICHSSSRKISRTRCNRPMWCSIASSVRPSSLSASVPGCLPTHTTTLLRHPQSPPGFSFSGEVRDPFREPIEALKNESRPEFEVRHPRPPIVSIDIPSAWDVELGNVDNRSFTPQVLLSLTAPKLGARNFTGRHFLGGRFVPEDLEEKYELELPEFPGSDQIVELVIPDAKNKQEEGEGASNLGENRDPHPQG